MKLASDRLLDECIRGLLKEPFLRQENVTITSKTVDSEVLGANVEKNADCGLEQPCQFRKGNAGGLANGSGDSHDGGLHNGDHMAMQTLQ